MSLLQQLREFVVGVGVAGFIDIAFVAVAIYALLVWLKRTRRAASVLVGILIVAAVYLVAKQFDMRLTAAMLQGFFAVILIALIVIFQEELRYLFEQVARWSLDRQRGSSDEAAHHAGRWEVLVRTLADLARERIGALVVVRGRDLLIRHLDAGHAVRAEIGESLLKSLFDPHSPGHDGAVVIEQGSVVGFGCHLPLSKNRELLGQLGTRHAAALGLAELTDALCLVVSEERGTISAAHAGSIGTLASAAELRRVLDDFLRRTTPARRTGIWRRLLTTNLREKLLAAALAVALWVVLVHGSRTVYATFPVTVDLSGLAPGLVASSVSPTVVEVTFSAPRKTLYFVENDDIRLRLPTWDLAPGRSVIAITPRDLAFPDNLSLENVKPREISIEIAAAPTGRQP